MANLTKEQRDLERDVGGLRLPREEVLQRHLALTASERTKKAILIKSARGSRIKIYERDLKHLRKIGNGNWRIGFYRAIALAKELWLTKQEINQLKNISPDGTIRGAIQTLLENKNESS